MVAAKFWLQKTLVCMANQILQLYLFMTVDLNGQSDFYENTVKNSQFLSSPTLCQSFKNNFKVQITAF